MVFGHVLRALRLDDGEEGLYEVDFGTDLGTQTVNKSDCRDLEQPDDPENPTRDPPPFTSTEEALASGALDAQGDVVEDRNWSPGPSCGSTLQSDGFSEWGLDADERMPDLLGELGCYFIPPCDVYHFPAVVSAKQVTEVVQKIGCLTEKQAKTVQNKIRKAREDEWVSHYADCF